MATLLFSTEGSVISNIISGFEDPTGGIVVPTLQMFIFFCVWYFWTITTYGVFIPAGLFLPGIIIGCALGSMFETGRLYLFDLQLVDAQVTPILISAGAMLAGYTRFTYSLVVIMLETTTSINLFVPMLVGVAISRGIGNLFNRSLYERALRMKQIPLLRNNAPRSTD